MEMLLSQRISYIIRFIIEQILSKCIHLFKEIEQNAVLNAVGRTHVRSCAVLAQRASAVRC